MASGIGKYADARPARFVPTGLAGSQGRCGGRILRSAGSASAP